ncbi:MAG: mechanosensitive ion channel family protein [Gemmatimonadetes bacterium]|nr:mechanosensitive ion channel family protein [Gemmatimonadota bacterium]
MMDWNEVTLRAARIGLVLLGGAGAYLILRAVRSRITRTTVDDTDDARQRAKTLAAVFTTTGIVVIVAVTVMTVVQELGVSLGPVLATAGIAGVAVGFGAQTLVKDMISGFFILLEDQYSLGDAIETAGVSGVVEEVNLRTTLLRDIYGVVHIVPNGDIRVVSNKTKEWSRAVLEIGVGYGEDPDRVIAVLEKIGAEIRDDSVYGALLLETPTVPGVEAFTDSAVVIRMMVRTLPLKQWTVARELRRRIKHRFDAEGIEIPFPQRTIWHRGDVGSGSSGSPRQS